MQVDLSTLMFFIVQNTNLILQKGLKSIVKVMLQSNAHCRACIFVIKADLYIKSMLINRPRHKITCVSIIGQCCLMFMSAFLLTIDYILATNSFITFPQIKSLIHNYLGFWQYVSMHLCYTFFVSDLALFFNIILSNLTQQFIMVLCKKWCFVTGEPNFTELLSLVILVKYRYF